MLSDDIRYYLNLMESAQSGTQLNEQHLLLINEIFYPDDAALTEGLMADVKAKAAAWLAKAKDAAGDVLPALVNRYDHAVLNVRKKLGELASTALESEMRKQAGADWKQNPLLLAAGLAVASTLLTANTASAGDYRHHDQHNRVQQQSPAARQQTYPQYQPQRHYHHHDRYRGGPVVVYRYVPTQNYNYAPQPSYSSRPNIVNIPQPNYAYDGIDRSRSQQPPITQYPQLPQNWEDMDQAEIDDLVREAVEIVLRRRGMSR